MKVCKFEKIKDEAEIKQIINSIQKERPYVIVVPVLTQLQEWLQNISISWFQDEDEDSHTTIRAITKYCFNMTDHFIINPNLNQEMKVIIQRCVENLHNLVEDKADLLIDKIIKAEVYKLSSNLLAFCLRERGMNAKMLDTSKFMQINLERKPDIPYIQENIEQYLNENRTVELFIAPLSLCKNIYGEIDFMSEAKNDYYATVLASIFKADEIVLSTELDNIYANQDSQREEHSLTYEEAENLINSGVHLLYTDCITLASRSKLVIRLTDTNDLITERLYISSEDTGNGVKAILTQDSVAFIRFNSLNVLPGYLLMGKLLEVISKYKIDVVSMVSSNVSISMLLNASHDTLRIIQRELHKYVEMVIDENMSAIHIIGALHWERTQMESKIMDTIKHIPISLIAYGGSDHCFTLSVHSNDKNKLLHSLSQHFLEVQSA
ncbi:aspartokinase [Bacteroides sp.]|uniref:amino acid kinase family protein n=1 Tax=Bacteroides sp. TaxID=29523 RepID=UPI00260DB74E|nr:aspartokinase [Bacteroides sp.]MDD3038742.1 aspartokinase [Bacteroides sp.]